MLSLIRLRMKNFGRSESQSGLRVLYDGPISTDNKSLVPEKSASTTQEGKFHHRRGDRVPHRSLQYNLDPGPFIRSTKTDHQIGKHRLDHRLYSLL